MFGAVMAEEDNWQKFLEMSLGFPIPHLEIDKEKSIAYHPEQKGVRLDVYAKDENNTRYNVEMQVVAKRNLPKRSRYYHSQMDMELLPAGIGYEELPDTYVIFICDFDPFGEGKYYYTFTKRCFEEDKLFLKDGCCTIFLSTCGQNENEVSKELVKFLKYVGSSMDDSKKDFEDTFVTQLQQSVQKVKTSREMEERYMLFEELFMEERLEGREEGRLEGQIQSIFDLLEELGQIPEELRNRIENERDSMILRSYLKKRPMSLPLNSFRKKFYKS